LSDLLKAVETPGSKNHAAAIAGEQPRSRLTDAR
jgi:hypothetical protein